MELAYTIWELFKDWYWLPLTILYIGVISTILIENRNPSKTIAWLLVIVFVPGIGLLLYYLFGQKFTKEKRLRKSSRRQIRQFEETFVKLEPKISESIDILHQKIGGLAKVFRYLKNEKLSLPSLRNEVKILINGEEKFEEMMDSLRHARHSIHLEYYIWELDGIGHQILDVLEERAREGVKVRVIVDAFGSPKFVRYMSKNKSTAIEFQPFLPISFTKLANSNYRNHRKIAVIDGEIGYIGGINIADKYQNTTSDTLFWRDTAARIQGESVALLQVNFWTSWDQTDGEPFYLDDTYLGSGLTNEGEVAVSYCASDPGSLAPHNMEALLVGISESESKIQLCTPYYVPSEELETALMVAVSSGIEVELMIPAEGDSWIVQHASFSFIKPLLQRGVKVYLYKKGFLHAKTIGIDGKLAYVGTMNLDARSFDINYEVMAVIADEGVCARLEEQFERDKQHCDQITLDDWMSRSRWKRGIDSICRLLAPLL